MRHQLQQIHPENAVSENPQITIQTMWMRATHQPHWMSTNPLEIKRCCCSLYAAPPRLHRKCIVVVASDWEQVKQSIHLSLLSAYCQQSGGHRIAAQPLECMAGIQTLVCTQHRPVPVYTVASQHGVCRIQDLITISDLIFSLPLHRVLLSQQRVRRHAGQPRRPSALAHHLQPAGAENGLVRM